MQKLPHVENLKSALLALVGSAQESLQASSDRAPIYLQVQGQVGDGGY